MALKNKEIELVSEITVKDVIPAGFKESFEAISAKLSQYQMILRDLQKTHKLLIEKVNDYKKNIKHLGKEYNLWELESNIKKLRESLDLNIQKMIGVLRFSLVDTNIEITQDSDVFSLDLEFVKQYLTEKQFAALVSNQNSIRAMKNKIDHLELLKVKLRNLSDDYNKSIELEINGQKIKRNYRASMKQIRLQRERVKELESKQDQSVEMIFASLGIKGATLTEKMQNLQIDNRAKQLEGIE